MRASNPSAIYGSVPKAGIMKLAAAHGVWVGTVQRISRGLALNAV
jgi:hypothetical protein